MPRNTYSRQVGKSRGKAIEAKEQVKNRTLCKNGKECGTRLGWVERISANRAY
jgi:hypothetical protein